MKHPSLNRSTRLICLMTLVAFGVSSSCVVTAQETAEKKAAASAEKQVGKTDTAKTPWRNLADHWEACEFGGDGEIVIKDGAIKLEHGDPFTGVVWTGPFDGDKKGKPSKLKPLPRDNYELRWECRRESDFDFMCAMTFPVGKDHVSLVLGGWGGGITGISSIDGYDASENNTTMFKDYENNVWYKARVRVETAKITVWVNGTLLFEQPRKGHEFDIRFEMDPCTPLGVANFECDSTIRGVQLRRLDPSELAAEESDN